MRIFYSPSNNAFYDEGIHGPIEIAEPQTRREIRANKRPRLVANPDCLIPADAIEITRADHAALLDAQSEGKRIIARNGRPAAVDREIDLEVVVSMRRKRRDFLLAGSDWSQLPDAPVDREAWAAYRQQLRDLDMDGTEWPAEPGTGAEG